ncbi:hypothetical protein [Nostoc sp. 106C]|nr:hypothetical protein [Nostoc sp. 106C]
MRPTTFPHNLLLQFGVGAIVRLGRSPHKNLNARRLLRGYILSDRGYW